MRKTLDWVMMKINELTAWLDNVTAGAMRTLFIITERGNNHDADALILAALQENGKVSSATAAALRLSNPDLVNEDGSIPSKLRAAIRHRLRTHHLAIEGFFPPELAPDQSYFMMPDFE